LAYLRLLGLVQSHDLVFLLTDSREARWLPTLLCSSLQKPLVNVALGFDTFVASRHGLVNQPTIVPFTPLHWHHLSAPCPYLHIARSTPPTYSAKSPTLENLVPRLEYCCLQGGNGLGCYFCNDVVAPRDSTRDRTLDQQCTVTRYPLTHSPAAHHSPPLPQASMLA